MRITSFALIAALGLAFGSMTELVSQAEQGNKTDEDRIVGTWRITKGQQNGEDAPPEMVTLMRLTFSKEGKMVINLLEVDEKKTDGEYKIVGPGQIDIGVQGDMSKGIYKFDGDDRLSICFVERPKGADRPTQFSSEKGSKNVFMVLERAKPGEKVSAEELAKMKEAVKKVREEAAASVSANNLRQIGLAMHVYHDDNNSFPLHAIYSQDGKTPLLSWRVAILPYIEQQALYKMFKLDEPWDSEHNKKLIAQIPQLYNMGVGDQKKEAGLTFYQVFTGPDTVFDGSKKMTIGQIVANDGASNTILAVEAKEPVIWTKPADLTLPKDKAKMPDIGGIFANRVHILLCDGSVQSAHNQQDAALLRGLVTPNGNENVDPGKLKKAD